jgi:uncharacterized protein (DUF1330 family)
MCRNPRRSGDWQRRAGGKQYSTDPIFWSALDLRLQSLRLQRWVVQQGRKAMKAKYALLGMIACFGLGGAAVQGLQAQTKPTAYAIAEVVVSNQNAYASEFLPPVRKSITDAGGKFLVAGGKTTSLQGTPPAPRVVVVQWENIDKARQWWDSQARKDAFVVGEKYATFRNFLVEGVSSP